MKEQVHEAKQVSEVGQRFNRFFKNQGLLGSEVAKLLGTNQTAISNLSGGANFSSSVLVAIIHRFPKLNLDWLLSGKGPMTLDTPPHQNLAHTQKHLEVQLDNLLKQAPPTTDVQAKGRIEQLRKIAKEAMYMRMVLLARLADMQQDFIQSLNPKDDQRG